VRAFCKQGGGGSSDADVRTSDVARPPSYKTKTTYFFKTKTAFFKNYQIINPRPLAQPEILIERAQIGKLFVTLFW